MADSTPSGASAATRPRWPYHGTPQVLLLVAGLVATIASFLPWLETPFGGASGALVGGTITFYAAVLAVPGAIWRRRGIVLGHALILAVPGIVVPLWRFAWAMRRLPGLGEAWLPGPGMVLVLVSGCVAAFAAVRLWQRTPLQKS